MKLEVLKRRALSARPLLGATVALGAAVALNAGPALAAPAKPAPAAAAATKVVPSKGFAPTALAAQKAINDAKANPAVAPAARQALDAAFAAATTPDDKFIAGQFAVALGGEMKDSALQRRGLASMLESGKVPAAEAPKYNFYLGSMAYDAKDYGAARAALQAAVQAGYHDNDADALLAEAYMQDNQTAQGLSMLQQAISQRAAAGNPAPQSWYRRGLGAAYKAKLLPQAAGFSIGLVKAYPTAENWAGAITVVREVAHYPAQEELDLMRLMDRTNSYAEGRDYVEYIQSADARRLPGEVLTVINKGIASGKITANDPFVAEARGIANGRIAADKASLPGLERDARGASATAATASAAGDAFLSYGDTARAIELYTLALGKPGVDRDRVLTRLGIAQVDKGDYAGAQATFAKVGGPRKPMADLWAIYAQQKAGGHA
ncbi:MAG: hypothetical protein JF593_00690 [Novosphingobium sp.]|nr:hypothetical protein [Novosphingobium sp.]